jgi:hypothetical protein
VHKVVSGKQQQQGEDAEGDYMFELDGPEAQKQDEKMRKEKRRMAGRQRMLDALLSPKSEYQVVSRVEHKKGTGAKEITPHVFASNETLFNSDKEVK